MRLIVAVPLWAGAGWALASSLPLISTKVALPDLAFLHAPNPALWAVVAGLVGFLYALLKPKHRRGYGSGENNRWNRRIRTERPKFQSKHHKLEHVWVYAGEQSVGFMVQIPACAALAVASCTTAARAIFAAGAGAKVDMEKARAGPTGTVTAIDPATECPLSGHLIGRQTWQVDTSSKAKKLKPLQVRRLLYCCCSLFTGRHS